MTPHELLSLSELARLAGCRVVLVERFFHLGVVEEAELHAGKPVFRPNAVDRVRRAIRIRADLRIGTSSLGLVLDLLERIERLEAKLERR